MSGSVGGPVVQDIGLNQQGSLPGVEVSRGDIGDPQITNNIEVSLCLSRFGYLEYVWLTTILR